MQIPITPRFLELVSDAALKSFWRRKALTAFLRRCNISDKFLAAWDKEESKRDFLFRLFPEVERAAQGPAVITKMARSLAEQTSFPDLEGWEDSGEKKRQAQIAMAALRAYLEQATDDAVESRNKEESRKRFAKAQQEAAAQRQTLEKLATRLDELARDIGSAEAGYKFQDWFYDVLDYYEMQARRPYVIDGRQIDGSVTVEGTTYLNELKFSAAQVGAPEIDVFYRKVQDKADNTMGIMVAMSGYSSTAIDAASGPRTPLLLLDYSHLYLLLSGGITFGELISRVRRHASQTCKAFLPVADFSG